MIWGLGGVRSERSAQVVSTQLCSPLIVAVRAFTATTMAPLVPQPSRQPHPEVQTPHSYNRYSDGYRRHTSSATGLAHRQFTFQASNLYTTVVPDSMADEACHTPCLSQCPCRPRRDTSWIVEPVIELKVLLASTGRPVAPPTRRQRRTLTRGKSRAPSTARRRSAAWRARAQSRARG